MHPSQQSEVVLRFVAEAIDAVVAKYERDQKPVGVCVVGGGIDGGVLLSAVCVYGTGDE